MRGVSRNLMPAWTTKTEEFEHVRKIMLSTAYFGGRRTSLTLSSGRHIVGILVSTKFEVDLTQDSDAVQEGQAATSRIFGELHVLPDVGSLFVIYALDVESIDPA
jgi:hypothetical protein